jgi:xylan 1,4-beta-xylosidase
MSYWTFTDIFDEMGPRFTPFHGGFGLLNLEGIKKPSFHAFKFLSRLKGEDVATNDAQSWVTKSNDGSISALVWDYSPVVPPDNQTDQIYYKQELPTSSKGQLTLNLKDIPNGKYGLAIYQIGYQQNDAFTAYVKMGSPKQLTRAQVEALKKISDGAPIGRNTISISNGRFTKTVPLRANDCYQMVLTPIKKAKR